MTTQQVANRLVELCRQGQFDTAIQELYGQDVVSYEPEGTPGREEKGLDRIIAKNQQFGESVQEFNSLEVSDPLVADNFFTVAMKMSITFKGAPGPAPMEEICVYKVENGKIVWEQFFYTPQPQHA